MPDGEPGADLGREGEQVELRTQLAVVACLRLRQLVTILADNAIAHSPTGSTVTVHVGPSADGAHLAVDDQGPGVREEDMAHVFDRFWRARGAPAGGTGLGLAIAAWIAQRHGGTIGVTNRPEGGARFAVRLPVRSAARA